MLTLAFTLHAIHNKISTRIREAVDKKVAILYSSSNFLVVNKQADLVINTDHPDKFPTSVQTQLKSAFPHFVNPRLKHDFHFCHRLDFVTSGAMCVALNRKASACVLKAFLGNKVEKYYLAIVRGHFAVNAFRVKDSIGKDSRYGTIHKMCVADESFCVAKQTAETRIIVLQRGVCYGYPATKVLLKPLTGRRHQLRVHCQNLGHTIVGDYTYSNFKDVLPHRTFLHAFCLKIPTELEVVEVKTEDPFSELDPLNEWVPIETVHKLEDGDLFKIFNDDNIFS